MTSSWRVVESCEYSEWFSSLTEKQRAAVLVRVTWLLVRGPTAGRPYVDVLKGSTLSHLKELRVSSSGQLRILCVFSSNKALVLLIGGDKSKSSQWNRWYVSAIREAERIYELFEKDKK
jgi:hypothetical protein